MPPTLLIVLIVILLAVGIAGVIAWRRITEQLEAERHAHEQEIANLAFEVRELLDAVPLLDSTQAKVGQCGKILRLLQKAGTFKECRDIINNYDQLRLRLEKLQVVFPAMEHVKAANRHQIRDRPKDELKSLVAAFEHIREYDITDEDIAIAEDKAEGGEPTFTVASVENRLIGMGWKDTDPLAAGLTQS